MILFMAFLQTLGVASIIPFMSVLGNPELVETNRWLFLGYNHLGFSDPKNFLFFLGLVVFSALVLSSAFKALTQWVMLRFIYSCNHSLSCRLLQGYLGRPYTWFLNRHSADLGKSVLSEASLVVNQTMVPCMNLITQGTVAIFLIILLVLVDSVLALIVALVLGGSYLFIYVILRPYLSRIGADRLAANKQRYQIAQEALGGIKEVKIFGRENVFFKRFVDPSFRFARNQANSSIAGILPSYFMEMLAFGGILLIAMYLFRTHESFGSILPVLGVYAFAGYRLMPALQGLYHQLARLRFGQPALDDLYKDILEFEQNQSTGQDPAAEKIFPKSAIILEDISFTYPQAKVPALENINLKVPANTTVGLVGGTGSGKTTTVDIMLGLLSPDKGRLLVDGVPIISDNVRSWQQALGYVPQHIYLADDTVAANIAFGLPPELIDMDIVVNAARIAEMHNFVVKEMPSGYETLVGERGIRLSGGQRQRIGIARALYHDPKVLVLDEATSALDNVTERQVMQSISAMKGKRTIILIAHRLTTVSSCDRIYFLDQGQIKAWGTYNELIEKSEQFKMMAGVVAGKE
jgi:ABC-type bacteriocin/lantibiotic exporter with double-glycine peptidase domain